MNRSAGRGIDLVARRVSTVAFSLRFYEVYEAVIEPPLHLLSLLSLSMKSRVARKCCKRARLSIACGFPYPFIAICGRHDFTAL